MNEQETKTLAITMVGFEFYCTCLENGSTPEQARKEMISEKGKGIIAKKVNEIMNPIDMTEIIKEVAQQKEERRDLHFQNLPHQPAGMREDIPFPLEE